MHRPWYEHVLRSHAASHSPVYTSTSHGWQSGPVKPAGHSVASGVSQCSPVHPGKHLHSPVLPLHRPWYEHIPALHAASHSPVYVSTLHGWQSGPVKPTGHSVASGVSQCSPVQPSSHLHVPVRPPQRPWCEHVAKSQVMLQAAEYEVSLHGRQSGPVKPHGQPQATSSLPLPAEPDPTPDPAPSEPMTTSPPDIPLSPPRNSEKAVTRA